MSHMGDGLALDDAVRFWTAARAEAEKIVREHEKAIIAADQPGCVPGGLTGRR